MAMPLVEASKLPNARPQRGVEMTWDMKAQTWVERQVTFFCADQPFAQGAMRKAFYIKFERNDRARGGDRMFVAKLAIDQKSMYNVDQYERDVKMQLVARQMAEVYNRNVPPPPKAVQFLEAFLLKCLDIQGQPVVGVEEYVAGEYKKYNNNWDWAEDKRNTPQAFSHWTLTYSRGKLLICDIQGVGDVWTDPQIHTAYETQAFGAGNCFSEGISRFLSSHRCNAICKYLGLPPTNQPSKHSSEGGTVVAPRQPAAHAVGGFVTPPPPRPHAASGSGNVMPVVSENADFLQFPSPSMPPALANQPIVQQQQPAAIAAAAAYAATAQAHVGELDIFSDFLSVPPTPRGGSAAPAPLPSPAALSSPVVANYPSPSPAEALGGARVSGGFESPVDQFAPSPSSNRERGLSNSTPNGSRKSSLAFNNEEQSKKWEHGEKCDRLRVVACSARNVMAKSYMSYFTKFFGGIIASSDCQCNLKFGSREYSTAVVEGTLQPTWNNAYDFNYDTSNAQHDRLHVEIIHVGLLGPKLLGCVDVAINTLDDSPDRCVTKWFELQSGPESKDRSRPRGEVLLSILRHPVRFHPTSTNLPPVIDPEKPDKHIVLQ